MFERALCFRNPIIKSYILQTETAEHHYVNLDMNQIRPGDVTALEKDDCRPTPEVDRGQGRQYRREGVYGRLRELTGELLR